MEETLHFIPTATPTRRALRVLIDRDCRTANEPSPRADL